MLAALLPLRLQAVTGKPPELDLAISEHVPATVIGTVGGDYLKLPWMARK